MSRAFVVGVIALAAGLPGCAGSVGRPYFSGYAVTYTSPPAYVETYPHVVYGGANAYLVDGRWYTPTPRGWAYYVEVPPPLRSYGYGGNPRGGYSRPVQQAPPAYQVPPAQQTAPVRQAPPAPRGPAPAPPATRVR